MKKFILSVGLMLIASMAIAQQHRSYDILNVKALQTGTNGWGVTNLANLTTNAGMIYNPTNTSYTNLAGTYVGVSPSYLALVGTTNSSTTAGLFKDIPLWTDSLGRPVLVSTVSPGPVANSNLVYNSQMNLFLEYINPLGSNAPFGFTLRPVWDGTTPTALTRDDWGFNIAGGAAAKGSFATNIPTWLWPGAKSLRVVQVTNLYVIGGPAGQTNSTFITKFSVNGFVP